MSDTDKAKDLLEGYLASALGTNALAAAEVQKQRVRVLKMTKTAADAMAGDATAETYGCDVSYNGRVLFLYWKGDADVAAHADNHATITVNKRDAAGANSATVGTLTSDLDTTTTWAEFVRKAFTLTDANTTVVAGGTLNYAIAKGGSGVVVPKGDILAFVVDEG